MCGIFSVISFSSNLSEHRFESALDKLEHRGPDDRGVIYHKPKVNYDCKIAMGHRRLSIFDLSNAGRQPMKDDCGRWLIYNGEIFNWPEVRKELVNHGYIFRTETDSEVILAAYDFWGPDCVKHFNGFWAFLIYDSGLNNEGSYIFVSRDRLGIKPLYYTRDGSELIFSSELLPIWHYQDKQPQVDIEQLSRYLIYDLSHDSHCTIYKDIFEIEPGFNALLNLSDGSLKKERYWQLPECRDKCEYSEKEAVEKFTYLIEDSVRLRLRSDREVAITLSGGIDSSVIAVAASRVSDLKIKAFTSYFPNRPDIDESNYAALLSNKLNIEHILVPTEVKNLKKDEHDLTEHQEMLYTSFSMLVNWAVVREIAAQDIVVYLTGQGGDEVFLGYERYLVPWFISSILKNPMKALSALPGAVQNSRLTWRELIGFLIYFSNTEIRGYRYRRDAKGIFSKQITAALKEHPISLPFNLNELQKKEIMGSQLRRLLRYDDRTASAFGVEARPALLDHRIVEFSSEIGWDYKIHNGWTKYILRKYLDNAGVPEIAWREHKLGYAAPTLDWTNSLIKSRSLNEEYPDILGNVLNTNLKLEAIPERLRFKVFNLISTALLLGWSNE